MWHSLSLCFCNAWPGAWLGWALAHTPLCVPPPARLPTPHPFLSRLPAFLPRLPACQGDAATNGPVIVFLVPVGVGSAATTQQLPQLEPPE